MGAMAAALMSVTALLLLVKFCDAYQRGVYVPMARRGQYHNMRTHWHDQLGRQCPRFPLNTEAVLPIPKPVGYTGADPYKISLQIGKEKFVTPWLFVVGRQGKEMPMLDVTLKYTGGDLIGATAKVSNLPQEYVEQHEQIFKDFWDSEKWPKHILVRYKWQEISEVDVNSAFYVLFGSAFTLTLVTALHVLQSSKEKIGRFVQENVIDSSLTAEEGKVE